MIPFLFQGVLRFCAFVGFSCWLFIFQKPLDPLQHAVDFGAQRGAFLFIVRDQREGFEDFLLLVGESSEVEIVATVREFLDGVFFGLGAAVLVDFPAVRPPFHNRGEMLQLHRLRFREMLVAIGHNNKIHIQYDFNYMNSIWFLFLYPI